MIANRFALRLLKNKKNNLELYLFLAVAIFRGVQSYPKLEKLCLSEFSAWRGRIPSVLPRAQILGEVGFRRLSRVYIRTYVLRRSIIPPIGKSKCRDACRYLKAQRRQVSQAQ
ncbi:MAG: hypothetical protein GY820_43240, partial [Gammaproteobacteria bacterium]|nr:hypothetical protein [Gammaproteobacteria bacterium]